MDAYGQGYAAFHKGIERNPFAEGSRWYSEWARGWAAAARASER